MDRERWKKIESILDEALSLNNREKQIAYIKKTCKKDRKLFAEIQLLMRCIRDAEKTGFMK